MKALQTEKKQVHLALVHHANQYVITDGYADRQGMNDILGLEQSTLGTECPSNWIPTVAPNASRLQCSAQPSLERNVDGNTRLALSREFLFDQTAH